MVVLPLPNARNWLGLPQKMKLSATLLRWETEGTLLESAVRRHSFTLWTLFKEGVQAFIDDHALTRGAAIAFYAVTAIAPVLFIATTIAGVFLGPDAASGAIRYQLTQVMSPASADMVQFAIIHVRGTHHTLAGSLIGLLALIFTASGVFTEIQDALNVIWSAPRKESYFYQVVRGRVLSLLLVVILGILLMVSMIFAGGVGFLSHALDRYTSLSFFVINLINLALSFGL